MAEILSERTFAETSKEILDHRAESLALETLDEKVTDSVSLLLFRISDEWYAVNVSDVREIFQEYSVTPVPCVPDFILGVVNVRGEILSVTDPARLMQLGTIESVGGVSPPVVVVNDGEVATALVVDEIGDIAEVANQSIEPPVSVIDRTQAEFISGSVFVNDTMIGLLNVARVLAPIGTTTRI